MMITYIMMTANDIWSTKIYIKYFSNIINDMTAEKVPTYLLAYYSVSAEQIHN